jgi:hypothetical protein
MPVTMVVVFASSVTSTSTGSSPSTTVNTQSTIGGTSSTSISSTGITLATSTSSSVGSTPTGPIQPATVNGVWTWYGCQTEATNMRALNSATFAADSMTLEACATYCTGFTYFGVEYARECYCGNSFNPGSGPALATDCNFKCMGNPLELCGAGLRLSVYTKNAVSPSSSSSSSSLSSSSSGISSTTSTSSTSGN